MKGSVSKSKDKYPGTTSATTAPGTVKRKKRTNFHKEKYKLKDNEDMNNISNNNNGGSSNRLTS